MACVSESHTIIIDVVNVAPSCDIIATSEDILTVANSVKNK